MLPTQQLVKPGGTCRSGGFMVATGGHWWPLVGVHVHVVIRADRGKLIGSWGSNYTVTASSSNFLQ
jgi:hypothetical protein